MPVAEELIPVPVPRSLLADVHELIVKHERALEEEADEADFALVVVFPSSLTDFEVMQRAEVVEWAVRVGRAVCGGLGG